MSRIGLKNSFNSSCGILLISALTLGCGQAIKVKRATYATTPADKLGIPFYVQTSVCEHQTTWLQPIYTVTLKKTSQPTTPQPPTTPSTGTPKTEEPTVVTRTVTLTLKEFRSEQVRDLYAAVNAAQKAVPTSGMSDTQLKNIEEKWQAVVNLAPADPFTVKEDDLNKSERVLKLANFIAPKVLVDYSTLYYYNVSKPLIGSAQVSLKLAPDGTMTEGSAQVETKTVQAFLDLLPVKDVLTAVATAALKVEGAPPVPPAIVKVELSSDARTYKHTHTAYVSAPTATPSLCPPPTGDLLTGYNLLVEDVTEPKKPEAPEQTISVSGSIQLPKPKEEPKK